MCVYSSGQETVRAWSLEEIWFTKESWSQENQQMGVQVRTQLDKTYHGPGAGTMKLLNLQLSTTGQFDWSKMHRRPIKLSVSAYLQV